MRSLSGYDAMHGGFGEAELSGNGADAAALFVELANLLTIHNHFRPAELGALLPCSRKARRHTFANQTALQFRHGSQHVDKGFSGSKDRRLQLDRLMKDAHQRRFDAVLVFKLDRFGRSTSHLIRSLETFQSLGIGFISLTECLDSTTAQGKLMFTMLSAFAEFERSMIVERINYGLDRARRLGKKLGRREVIVSKDCIAAYRREGRSYRWIATTLGVSVGKVHSIVAAA